MGGPGAWGLGHAAAYSQTHPYSSSSTDEAGIVGVHKGRAYTTQQANHRQSLQTDLRGDSYPILPNKFTTPKWEREQQRAVVLLKCP